MLFLEKQRKVDMDIPFATFRSKVLGCWLGKAVGGTLGGPWEGHDGPLDLTFYDPIPTEMLPNDDLDLQVVWLETIRRGGLPVDRRLLADAWLRHVRCWCDEYGVACRNLTMGIHPPASGAFDNGFTAGMGAAIRSEIWACLAPGDPLLAAGLAREDACVDHAGEGIHAEVFLASLQSAAFVESDVDVLLEVALDAIPADCRVACAVRETCEQWAESGDWKRVREHILQHHGRQNFTDVAQNLAITILGWLAGDGDFGQAICTAVNCGKDTDCTGATLGALLGIIAPDSIGESWLEPIGQDLVLSPPMVGLHPAVSLDNFTDQIVALATDVLKFYGSENHIVDVPELKSVRANMAAPRHPSSEPVELDLFAGENESLVATEPVIVIFTYPRNTAFEPGEARDCQLELTNPTDDILFLDLTLRVPDGWDIDYPTAPLQMDPGESVVVMMTITPPGPKCLRTYWNPLVCELRVNCVLCVVTAGLPLTIPWRRWELDKWPEGCPEIPSTAPIREAPGHSQGLPDGMAAFATDLKLPNRGNYRFIVQAPRPVRVWLDGELINEHGGTYLVPAVHRARETGVDVEKRSGWHRVVIAVQDGEDGELFFGVGTGANRDWVRDAEYRLVY